MDKAEEHLDEPQKHFQTWFCEETEIEVQDATDLRIKQQFSFLVGSCEFTPKRQPKV